jgi:hypothetical protein
VGYDGVGGDAIMIVCGHCGETKVRCKRDSQEYVCPYCLYDTLCRAIHDVMSIGSPDGSGHKDLALSWARWLDIDLGNR